MLLEKGDILNGVTYIHKAYLKTSIEIKDNLIAKGFNYFFDHEYVIESIFEFYRESYTGAIIKLKTIYREYDKNPIINFFIAIYYLTCHKIEKAKCFLQKLLLVNNILKFDRKSFLNTIIKKSKNILKYLELESINSSDLKEVISFHDFPNLNSDNDNNNDDDIIENDFIDDSSFIKENYNDNNYIDKNLTNITKVNRYDFFNNLTTNSKKKATKVVASRRNLNPSSENTI